MASVSIIGGGPAGLMAAEIIAKAGHSVTIYDHMPSIGRKFLMAGRGGLNLTHSEDLESLIARYGKASAWLAPTIRHFPPEALRAWCHDLGQPTFVGSSGRVFPKCLKASPLLRAWLARLDKLGVHFALKHKWTGWDNDNHLIFTLPDGKQKIIESDATLMALGGASWPRLGSTGGWVDILKTQNIPVTTLVPANCGFVVPWSDIFRDRFAGQPLKPITLSFKNTTLQGEAMITTEGIEGGAIYALSALLRDAIEAEGSAILSIDLRPGLSHAELAERLAAPQASRTLSNHLRRCGGLSPVAIGLIFETVPRPTLSNASPAELARLIKACRLQLTATSSIARAISTSGGISRDALNEHFMLRTKPSVFVAGEMLDWEAPTGGYLLQACFSTAVAAAEGMLAWIGRADKLLYSPPLEGGVRGGVHEETLYTPHLTPPSRGEEPV